MIVLPAVRAGDRRAFLSALIAIAIRQASTQRRATSTHTAKEAAQ